MKDIWWLNEESEQILNRGYLLIKLYGLDGKFFSYANEDGRLFYKN